MDFERINGPDGLEIRVPSDESYRTCAECGGDCEPDPAVCADGFGVRIAWICPRHGLQTIADPFEDLR
ncbi:MULTISPECIES: hypothetical protein [Arthrobacter]|uniref:Uncharacterized protein n=2 Tax=Arthrobacter TaxID=1663 RepID=A0ABU9KIZ0_9MICC|nr:hypothetical protein [Arthrobacter sp. YJM1]MDP5226892.1 hypothetical protein [Arthrobacter sp. YJM1]